MEEDIKKSYYAIIPANVRYDKDITPIDMKWIKNEKDLIKFLQTK